MTFEKQNMSRESTIMDYALSRIIQSENELTVDSSFISFINSRTTDLKTPGYHKIVSDLKTQLSECIFSNTFIKDISVYNSATKEFISTNSSFENKKNISSIIPEKKTIYLKTGENTLFIRTIYSGDKILGYITATLNSASLNSLLNTDSKIAVITENNSLIYGELPENFHYEKAEQFFTDNKITEIYDKHSKSYTFFIKLEETGFIVVKNFPSSNVSIYNKNIYFTIVLIAIVLIAILLILSYFLAMYYYNTFAELIKVIKEPYSDFGKSDKNDEFYYITKNIASMSEKIENTETELAKKLSMLKQAQLSSLLNQINPHFIFNTLQSVNLSIISELKQDNEASKIISLLSDLLSEVMHNKNTITDFANEISYAKKYMEIQNLKFQNKYTIFWDIDEKTYHLKTLKLILQPILENSIIHGFDDDTSDNTIIVRAFTLDDKFIISVSDTGKGISENKLLEINRILESEVPPESHIGLYNINKRIKIIMGNNCGITVSSNYGTTVTVTQPIIYNTNFEEEQSC